MRLDVYVNYKGTCEEAFRFYEKELGARILGANGSDDRTESATFLSGPVTGDMFEGSFSHPFDSEKGD